MHSITVEELIKILPSDKVIDIRDNYQYNVGKIPGAVNIPMNFLVMNPENYLNKNNKYYIYCEYGSRSKQVCTSLLDKGFDVVNVTGGYNGYQLFIHKKQ